MNKLSFTEEKADQGVFNLEKDFDVLFVKVFRNVFGMPQSLKV